MRAGNVASNEQVLDCMAAAIQQADAHFRGLVLDGLPNTLDERDMLLIQQAASQTGHVPVFIQLNISDDNLLRRRAARWIDPLTNEGYSGAQVLYSRQRRADGYVDGEEDTVGVEERQALYEPRPVPVNSLEDKKPEEGEEEVPIVVPTKRPIAIKNQTSWVILSEQILSRLIKDPFDDPVFFKEHIERYNKAQKALDDFRNHHFNILNIVDLDATQHPDLMFDQMKKIMLFRGYSVFNPVILPKKIASVDGGFKGLPDSEVWKFYLNSNLNEGEVPREQSSFGKYCSVTFATQCELVETDMNYAVSYKNRVYFFQDEKKQDMFFSNPEKYLAAPFEMKTLKICVLGAPLSGKTTFAKLLSKRYGIQYINVDDILSDDSNPVVHDILVSLKSGSIIQPDQYAQLVNHTIQNILSLQDAKGWILDGFPRTAAQASALLEAGVKPSHVLSLNASILY